MHNDDADDDFELAFLDIETTLTRLIGDVIHPSVLKLKFGISIISDDDNTVNNTIEKINLWFDNFVFGSFAISSSNKQGFEMILNDEMIPLIENPLMITPFEPTEDVMMALFKEKVKALSEGCFDVMSVEITANNSYGMTFVQGGDDKYLPSMKEWIKTKNWFTKPWWKRDDISIMDVIAPKDADFSIRPDWAVSFDYIMAKESKTPAVIITGNFNPKIIDNET